MKSIETTINIKGSKENVWEVLMDFKAYKEWNPFIVEIQKQDESFDKLTVLLRQENGKQMKFKPRVLVKRLYEEFRWRGKLFMPGIFDGEHYFKLTEQENGTTTLSHGERFSGILSNPILKSIGEETKANFMKMNVALKARVEQKNPR